jgi:quinolinate synthetase A subunit
VQQNKLIAASLQSMGDVPTAGIADLVGDSLAMARYAARRVIVVCGVHFMAETVKLLCPNKQILLPDLRARCSFADSATAGYVRTPRRRNPDLPIVAYVNTPAAVEAIADICCTSTNVTVARPLGGPRILEDLSNEIDIDATVAEPARQAVERMLAH